MYRSLPLPHRMYLLGHDVTALGPEHAGERIRGHLVRGAALADLRIGGHLLDRDGRAVRADLDPPADPFLAEIVDSLSRVRPRRWSGLVEQRGHPAAADVRDRLAADGVLALRPRRMLGSPADPGRRRDRSDAGHGHQQHLGAVLAEDLGPAEVTLGDAVLAMLADDGDVRPVLPVRARPATRRSRDALVDRVETELPGLRAAWRSSIAARRGGGADGRPEVGAARPRRRSVAS